MKDKAYSKTINKSRFIFALCFSFFTFHFSLSFAKSGKLDSLHQALSVSKNDTDKAKTLNNISSELDIEGQFDSSLVYSDKAKALAEKLISSTDVATALAGKKQLIDAYRNTGQAYDLKGQPTRGVEAGLKALTLVEELGDKKNISGTLNGIGNMYVDLANYLAALDYYKRALKIAQDIGDKQLQVNAIGNIGLIYGYQSDYPNALEYDLQALSIAKELGNKVNIAADLGNIGSIYYSENDSVQALKYLQEALKMNEDMGDKGGEAIDLEDIAAMYSTMNNAKKAIDYLYRSLRLAQETKSKDLMSGILSNMGSIYGDDMHAYDSAEIYFEKGLQLAKEVGNKSAEASAIGSLGAIYASRGEFKKAEVYVNQAIAMNDIIGDKVGVEHSEELLAQLYDTTGRSKLAYDEYKKAMILKDSIFNGDKSKLLTQKEMTYEFKEKEDLAKVEQDKKDTIALQEHKRDVIIRDFFIVGFVLLLALAFFIYRGYRDKKKDNEIITHQKELVEEKQKEILDSIHYAQRIQKALLASDVLLKQYLDDYFVLYKPKDIVSGDFYWATVKDGRFYLGICDSTGHGVPGAFMSLLNISFMNEAITEKSIKQPNEVFNHTRKRLIENISQDGQQDGMDGTLLCLDTRGLKLEYAAAYNSPVIIRNGELIELEGDKIPVGSSPKDAESFTYRSVDLKKGDMLYAFTDGYGDQFGGPKGKKFKSKHLYEKLIAISHQPLADQKNELNTVLETWKNNLEQVDDILVVGIRV